MLRREDFRACHEALVPPLLKWRTLPGEIVEGILAEAIANPEASAEQLASEGAEAMEVASAGNHEGEGSRRPAAPVRISIRPLPSI
jgi:hypothetical protein